MRRWVSVLIVIATIGCVSSYATTDEPRRLSNLIAKWTQFTASNELEEREIYTADQGECPEGSVERLPPSWAKGDFPIRVCSRPTTGALGPINTVVVIGDTGCRTKHSDVQDCDHDWPLKHIADLAANRHPDLVIHVGDYLYKETCPYDAISCPTINVGDQWKAWEDDFFRPASALLQSAP